MASRIMSYRTEWALPQRYFNRLCLRSKIAADVWDVADKLNMTISITHLAGKLNTEPDMASRILSYRTKWALPQRYFNRLCSHFNVKSGVDTFASRLKMKLPHLCTGSILYACGCIHLLMGKQIYLFFPLSISSTGCYKKFKWKDKCAALIVYPLWPYQLWFSTLNKMTTMPVQLPATCRLFLPWDKAHQQMTNLKWCSTVLYGRDFRRVQCTHNPQNY